MNKRIRQYKDTVKLTENIQRARNIYNSHTQPQKLKFSTIDQNRMQEVDNINNPYDKILNFRGFSADCKKQYSNTRGPSPQSKTLINFNKQLN